MKNLSVIIFFFAFITALSTSCIRYKDCKVLYKTDISEWDAWIHNMAVLTPKGDTIAMEKVPGHILSNVESGDLVEIRKNILTDEYSVIDPFTKKVPETSEVVNCVIIKEFKEVDSSKIKLLGFDDFSFAIKTPHNDTINIIGRGENFEIIDGKIQSIIDKSNIAHVGDTISIIKGSSSLFFYQYYFFKKITY